MYAGILDSVDLVGWFLLARPAVPIDSVDDDQLRFNNPSGVKNLKTHDTPVGKPAEAKAMRVSNT